VGLNLRHHLLSLGVLANLSSHQRVLHQRHVNGDVGVVVLVDERLGWLTVQEGHVLRHWIAWLHVVFNRNQLVCVANTQHFNHLAVQLRQVVNLRGRLGQLNHSLVLHDPLSHGRAVWVRHWNDFHHVVVFALDHRVTTLRVVLVLAWRVVANDVLEELELLLHGEMHTRLHGAHSFKLTFKQSKRSSNRRVGTHVADLHVGNRAKASAFFRYPI
jgi:hypothetical protein